MHLSCQEILEKVYERAETVEEFERWEAAFVGPRAVVYRNERATKTEGSRCSTCGRDGGTAELYSEVGRDAQLRADRALWFAAEPVPWPDAIGKPEW